MLVYLYIFLGVHSSITHVRTDTRHLKGSHRGELSRRQLIDTFSHFSSKKAFEGSMIIMTTRTRNDKGMGSIVAIGNNKFKVRIELPKSPSGTRKVISRTVTGKTEANKVRKELLRQRDDNTLFTSSQNALTYTRLASEYLNERAKENLKATTMSSYRSTSRIFGETFAVVNIQHITYEHICDYFNKQYKVDNLTGTSNRSTLKTRWVFLKNMFAYAVDKKYIAESPFKKLPRWLLKSNSMDTTGIKVFTLEQLKVINEYLKEHYSKPECYADTYLYVVFQLIINTGMRLGEALAPQAINFDYDNHILNVAGNVSPYKGKDGTFLTTPKTMMSRRPLILSEGICKLLKEHLKKNLTYSTFIFCSKQGTLLQIPAVREAFRKVFRKCGIPADLTVHCLRHTYATRCIEAGINIKTVSQRLGHSSVVITLNTYTHYLQQAEQLAAGVFEDELKL